MLPVLIILAIAFHYLGEERFLTGQNLSIVRSRRRSTPCSAPA
jgi:hypothetical protein